MMQLAVSYRSLNRQTFAWLRTLGAVGLIVASSTLVSPDGAQADAGRTTAVTQESLGTPPTQPTRVLIPSLDVFQDERIQTDDMGVAQILFVDGSNLTIGPNSDLHIDRFVYDPETSTGELAANLGRGVLRFVGGQVSKWGDVSITTPVAIVGVRGGIVIVEHDDAGGTDTVLLFGEEMTIAGLGTDALVRQVSRPGFSVTVGNDGRVSEPVRVTSDQLDATLSALEGNPDSDGGAPTRPTNESVQESVYVETSEPTSERRVADLSVVGGDVDQSAIVTQHRRLDASEDAPALWRYTSGTSRLTHGLSFLASESVLADQLLIAKRQGDFLEVMKTGGYPFLAVRSIYRGEGSQQVGGAFVLVGSIVQVQLDENRFLGNLEGAARDSGSSAPASIQFVNSFIDEDPNLHGTSAFDDLAPPSSFNVITGSHPYFFGAGFLPDVLRTEGHLEPEAIHTSAGGAQWTFGSSSPLESVVERGDRRWNGYATALFEARTTVYGNVNDHIFQGAYSLRNISGSPNDVSVRTDAELANLGSVFKLGLPMTHEGDPNSQIRLSDNVAVSELEILFGYDPVQPQINEFEVVSRFRGTYIDDDTFGGLLSHAYDQDRALHRLGYVNGQLAPGELDSRFWMFSNEAASADGLLPPGVEYCDCAAAKFGWWGGRIGVLSGDEGVREDAAFPGTFVVGDLPDVADLPNVGVATYAGHSSAAIRNDGDAYAAVGRFQMDWDFAMRSGEARITNLDGRSYLAQDLAAPLVNPRDFNGSLTQVGGPGIDDPATGPMVGSFFSDGSNPVSDVGGQFAVQAQDLGYSAVGSFAATDN